MLKKLRQFDEKAQLLLFLIVRSSESHLFRLLTRLEKIHCVRKCSLLPKSGLDISTSCRRHGYRVGSNNNGREPLGHSQ